MYKYLVVAYDIVSDKRRKSLVDFLKAYGTRVNYSVFECRVPKAAYGKFKSEIEGIIDGREDCVLFYPLCLNCLEKRESAGIGFAEEDSSLIFV